MKVEIPPKDAEAFASLLGTSEYAKNERNYKWAVHLVISALLSEENAGRADLPELIADVFGSASPDLERLGLRRVDQDFIAAAGLGGGGVRAGLSNLAGGRWGLAQFLWIPRAIQFDLGRQVADAMLDLVGEDKPVAERVDLFRDRMYGIEQELERKGGFESNWHLLRLSLSFVAVLLAGFDPERYTFYSEGALKSGYAKYAPGEQWPSGSAGERYADLCGYVQDVAAALRAAGVPVQDLIDAQGFIWTRFRTDAPPTQKPASKQAGGTESTADLDAVAMELAKKVHWSLDRALELTRLVSRSGQVVFQGPPGTGKTFIAETLANLFAGDEEGRLEVVPFHPSYAYEDFVEGIRPVVTEGSALQYEIRRGTFLKMASLAQEHSQDTFFLVIDELNRANLPRVLGELIYALEYRGPEHPFRLLYSGGETYVPANLKLIATMNTADRSIALVDAAIRRRFRHVRFDPDYGVLAAWLKENGLQAFADDAVARLRRLNEALLPLVGADRLVGHSYLMRRELSASGLSLVWDEDIGPLLEEHLFSQPEDVARLRGLFLTSG